MNFSFLFKTKSWQSVVAAEVDAARKRAANTHDNGRRINLIDCEASLDYMLLSLGERGGSRLSRMKHLVSGASARLALRAAPDIRLNAGVSNYWQIRHGSQPAGSVARSTETPREAQRTEES